MVTPSSVACVKSVTTAPLCASPAHHCARRRSNPLGSATPLSAPSTSSHLRLHPPRPHAPSCHRRSQTQNRLRISKLRVGQLWRAQVGQFSRALTGFDAGRLFSVIPTRTNGRPTTQNRLPTMNHGIPYMGSEVQVPRKQTLHGSGGPGAQEINFTWVPSVTGLPETRRV